MKGIRIFFLSFFIVLVSISSIKAEVHPPKPERAVAAGGLDDDGDPIPVPGPVPVSIDRDIFFLLGAGLVLGLTAVYKNKIKKASM
ncbi:hypothetical protein [Flavobacterium bizetiae]|nr:hypothetical protein [Flavobacterium bizetiae]